MEILKEGLHPSEKVAEFGCHECGGQYRAKISEGDYVSDQRDGDFVQFECPCCKQTLNVLTKKFKAPHKPTA